MNNTRHRKSEISHFKFICIKVILIDCIYQFVIITYWKKVNAKTFFPLDIGISMCVLIQVPQNSKKSCFISMKVNLAKQPPILFIIPINNYLIHHFILYIRILHRFQSIIAQKRLGGLLHQIVQDHIVCLLIQTVIGKLAGK